jgi:hypothetical protein
MGWKAPVSLRQATAPRDYFSPTQFQETLKGETEFYIYPFQIFISVRYIFLVGFLIISYEIVSKAERERKLKIRGAESKASDAF